MIQDLLLKKPYLVWYVKDKRKLSKKAAVEAILNYGTWQDFLEAERILGVKEMRSIFEELKKKRGNLRVKTINYFNLYFSKYA